MNTDKHRYRNWLITPARVQRMVILSVSICVYLWLIFLSSCTTKPTNMRSLVPADTLVYLETNDLAAALQPIVDSKPFTEVAKSKPDFSGLKGVQLAVAVTGFETSEEKLTDEQSVGRIQPRFVAVADTHAWNYQAVAFAEQKLGSFVEDIYDSEPKLEKSDKHGGKYFVWTAADGRKAYALVIDSLIYFANDESAIDKALAVRRGEADSILKTNKIQLAEAQTLASGYVSTDGIAQIAALAGLKFAKETSDDSEVQSTIADILPQLIRNTVTDITWTSTKTDQGIEDKYQVAMPPDVANIFNETIASNGEIPEQLLSNLSDPESATRYNLKSPQLAWRSVLLVFQKQVDPLASKMLSELSGTLFEPYGIRDPELFFSSVDSNIITGREGLESEFPFVVATVQDMAKVKKSIVSSLKPTHDERHWLDDGGELRAFFGDDRIMMGSSRGLAWLTDHGAMPPPPIDLLTKLKRSKAPIATGGYDRVSSGPIAEILSEKTTDDAQATSIYFTETRSTRTGMERKTTSDFGFIGWMIAQITQD